MQGVLNGLKAYSLAFYWQLELNVKESSQISKIRDTTDVPMSESLEHIYDAYWTSVSYVETPLAFLLICGCGTILAQTNSIIM